MKYLAALMLLSIMACRRPPDDLIPATPFEQDSSYSANYEEAMQWYRHMAKYFKQVDIIRYGKTDCGIPLHLVIWTADGQHDVNILKGENRPVMLIMNAIHPGEPDGVDASMLLLKNLVQDTAWRSQAGNTVVLIIPFYNIDGAMHRGCCSRASQNGPAEYGFRANDLYLDLNRDFMKADAQTTRAFYEIFHEWDPDVFVDNHVSNGADYQYTFTLLATQTDRLGLKLGKMAEQEMLPQLYDRMEQKGLPMVPYVNVFSTPPDSGYEAFFESARFATGYTSLFHTVGLVSETHMLKPFKDRVLATRTFMESTLQWIGQNGDSLHRLRLHLAEEVKHTTHYPLGWMPNRRDTTWLDFKGYKSVVRPGSVTGLPGLFYDTTQPVNLRIPYFHHYEPTEWTTAPKAFVISKIYENVAELLRLNRVYVHELNRDTVLTLETYRVLDFNTGKWPYEGHYLHRAVQVEISTQQMELKKGDYVVYVNQESNRYIMEAFEPRCEDSYFAWNFFDAHLQQKEGYSAYVFEDRAAEWLKYAPKVKTEFDAKRQNDTAFARSRSAQLNWLYARSPWKEPGAFILPVYRYLGNAPLPVD